MRFQISVASLDKFDVEFEDTLPLSALKAKIEQETQLPALFQKIIAKGKEVRDSDTTAISSCAAFAALDSSSLIKLRVLKKAGAPAELFLRKQEPQADECVDEVDNAPPAMVTETRLIPQSEGVVALAFDLVRVSVKQGRNSHVVLCPAWKISDGVKRLPTLQELAEHLAVYCVPNAPEWKRYRFLAKGKEIAQADWGSTTVALTAASVEIRESTTVAETKVLLLFREGHYRAMDAREWLKDRIEETGKLEGRVGTLKKRAAGRLGGEELFLEVFAAEGVVGAVLTSLLHGVAVEGLPEGEREDLKVRLETLAVALREIKSML